MASEQELRQNFYAEIICDCDAWLQLLAKKDNPAHEGLREEVERLRCWADMLCTRAEQAIAAEQEKRA